MKRRKRTGPNAAARRLCRAASQGTISIRRPRPRGNKRGSTRNTQEFTLQHVSHGGKESTNLVVLRTSHAWTASRRKRCENYVRGARGPLTNDHNFITIVDMPPAAFLFKMSGWMQTRQVGMDPKQGSQHRDGDRKTTC